MKLTSFKFIFALLIGERVKIFSLAFVLAPPQRKNKKKPKKNKKTQQQQKKKNQEVVENVRNEEHLEQCLSAKQL